MGATASKDDAVAAVNAGEIEFEHELDAWIGGLLEDGWNRGVRRQAEGEKGLTSFVQERLSGLGATTLLVAQDDDLQRPSHRRGSTLGLGNSIASFAWTVHA